MKKTLVEKVLERLLRESPREEAFWITPRGERVEVPPGSHHDSIAAERLEMEYDPEEWEYSLTPSDLYIDRGAIKGRSYDRPGADLDLVSFAVKRLTPSARDVLARHLRGQPPRRRLIVTVTGAEGPSDVDTTVGDFLRGDAPGPARRVHR